MHAYVLKKCVPHGTQLLFRQPHLSLSFFQYVKEHRQPRFRLIDGAKVVSDYPIDKLQNHPIRIGQSEWLEPP